jgi:hypothetical protein
MRRDNRLGAIDYCQQRGKQAIDAQTEDAADVLAKVPIDQNNKDICGPRLFSDVFKAFRAAVRHDPVEAVVNGRGIRSEHATVENPIAEAHPDHSGASRKGVAAVTGETIDYQEMLALQKMLRCRS